jgi:hypothetical protein
MMSEEKKYPIEINGVKIDPIIFTQGFVPKCDIPICSGQCCDWGVYMDKEFKHIIMDHEQDVIDVMDNQQIKDSEKWFEKDIEIDHDFPSGEAIGTETYKTKFGNEQCVFKGLNNFCSLQVAAEKKGYHKWGIKPKYCIMYPLTIVDNVLTYDDSHAERLDYCGINKTENFVHTVFEAMTEEIIYILGQEGYNYLNDYFIHHYKNKENK